MKAILGNEEHRSGMYALENIEPFCFNLLCIPAAAYLDIGDYTEVYSRAINYCARKRVGTSEWKYVPVRLAALFIEESLYQGLKWVVFNPNAASFADPVKQSCIINK
jgi:hypothetical protein